MPPPTLSRKRPLASGGADDSAEPESTCPQKRKATNIDEGVSTRLPKRRRRDKGSSSATTRDKSAMSPIKNEGCTLTAIPIARTTMFYARPQRRAAPEHIQLGLPSDHILNRMNSGAWRVAKGLLDTDGRLHDVRPADRHGALEARHFSKYVFPLRYRLDNVFSVRPERQQEDQFARFRFANRETEIEIKGSCKTPDRLKSVLPLLSQLYHRHTKCGYKAL
ncbi:uncharacterized protein FOMMEDRAFT_117836, partial [Fomitiporia mediterranea MF3/22]|uniref:uncharacterized protein n=1 Tax=Fomitiporia mediterranea (strain MF3/22) TaxID=694068 RepID=UPI00044096A8